MFFLNLMAVPRGAPLQSQAVMGGRSGEKGKGKGWGKGKGRSNGQTGKIVPKWEKTHIS